MGLLYVRENWQAAKVAKNEWGNSASREFMSDDGNKLCVRGNGQLVYDQKCHRQYERCVSEEMGK